MMDQKFVQDFRSGIQTLGQKLEEFERGELSRKDYKGYSGGFGSYAQREIGKSMLRLRCPGGRLTKEKLAFLVKMAQQYHVDKIKLTTCQTMQFHDLRAQEVPAIMDKVIEVGIYTKGGGGDNPRNVMCSPLAGVEKGEFIDCTPYAQAATEYLLGISGEIKMPRKLKVSFCGGASDDVHATFRDMGFVANEDGSFRLYIAGGMGASNPREGLLVEEHLDPADILAYIRAMVDTFIENGNYENRAKARTRFMRDTLGDDGLREAFHRHLQAVKNSVPRVEAKPCSVEKAPNGQISGPRIIEQKQPGLYAVIWHPLGGLTDAQGLARVWNAIAAIDCAEARIAPNESMYLINLTAKEAQTVLDATQDGAQSEFEYSKVCIGAAICQQGLRDSQAVLRACAEAVREAGVGDCLPRICISGCPSSCSSHLAGEIGFQGSVKSVDGKPQSAFKMYVGGSDVLGKESFGTEAGTVLEREMPALLIAWGKAVQESGLTWKQWRAQSPDALLEIAQPYL